MKIKHIKKEAPQFKGCVKESGSNDEVGLYENLSKKPDEVVNHDSLSGDKLLDDAFKKAFGKKTKVGK